MPGKAAVKIAIFQFPPAAGNIEENKQRVQAALQEASAQGATLVLLPELWSTGLLSPRMALDAASATPGILEILVSLCEKLNLTVVGSLPEADLGNSQGDRPTVWNTTFVTCPGKVCAKYRKINLFMPMGEHRVFTPGTEHVVFSVPGVPELRAGLMTCFDLRFPELARDLVWKGAGLVLVSALWPMVRKSHFELLMQARAVENQCFVAGANACGTPENMEFAGASSIIDPVGDVLCSAGSDQKLLVHEIDPEQIKAVRQRFVSSLPPVHQACSSSKFLPVDELVCEVRARKQAGQKMVFTNGCFDLLHAGHVHYLTEARRQGHFLVLGLNSDSSIRAIKGPDRPVNTEERRAAVLSALECVDYVTLFGDPTPENLITRLEPDVLVKGADWEEDAIVGASFVKSRGGKVVRIPFIHPTSTTDTINRIRIGG